MTIEEFMRDIAPKKTKAGLLWIRMKSGFGTITSLKYISSKVVGTQALCGFYQILTSNPLPIGRNLYER